jgi:hypothetical protein
LLRYVVAVLVTTKLIYSAPQAILSQFTRKTKDNKSDEDLDENDPLDEEEQQAISELDLDQGCQ